MQEGYIQLARRLFEHPFWQEKREFSKAEAWLDLIQSAQWKPGQVSVKGKIILLKRGQAQGSLRYWQTRWNWGSPDKVKRYFTILQEQRMVTITPKTVTQVVTLNNYERYNPVTATRLPNTEIKFSENGTTETRQQTRQTIASLPSSYDDQHDRHVSETRQTHDRRTTDARQIQERKNKRIKETTTTTAVVEVDKKLIDWFSQLRTDEIFIEQVKRQHQITETDYHKMLNNFYRQKKALGELGHRRYSDLRKNFLFWIPKHQQFSKTAKTADDQGIQYNGSIKLKLP